MYSLYYRYAPSKRWHIDTIMRVLTTVRTLQKHSSASNVFDCWLDLILACAHNSLKIITLSTTNDLIKSSDNAGLVLLQTNKYIFELHVRLSLTSLLILTGRELRARRFCSQPHPAHHQQRGDACLHSTETLQSTAGWHITGESSSGLGHN